MLLVRCPFCHRRVLRWWYRRHEAKHTRLRPDGQMTDHVTLPSADRYQGSLAGVPQGYRHERCGAVTRMPEEIIRSYLGNPYLYSGGSFCCGCNDYVPYGELFWHETGQCLWDYFRELQNNFIKTHGLDNPDVRKRYIEAAMQQRTAKPTAKLVEITPAAAARIREAAKMSGVSSPWWVRVTMKLPLITIGGGNFAMDIETIVDRQLDEVEESQGLKTVIAKEYAELLRGIRVDYRDGPDGPAGFAIDTPFATR
jgi:Fe-S cluster assembly iron-binding protein IscA